MMMQPVLIRQVQNLQILQVPPPPSRGAPHRLPRSEPLPTRRLPPVPVEESHTLMKEEPA